MYIVCSRPEDGLRCRQGVKPPLNQPTSPFLFIMPADGPNGRPTIEAPSTGLIAGTAVNLTCSGASLDDAGSPPVTYTQWYRDQKLVNNSTLPTYTLHVNSVRDSEKFQCSVSNKVGVSNRSDSLELHVKGGSSTSSTSSAMVVSITGVVNYMCA